MQFESLRAYRDISHTVTQKNILYPIDNSMALHTGEDTSAILSNRQSLLRELEGLETLCTVSQTHSTDVHVVSENTASWSTNENVTEADAQITNIKGVALGILTADCVPILLYDFKNKAVGVVHAGWKGTKGDIVSKTVHSMSVEYGTSAADLIACIGPAIGQCCYEVGYDVAGEFDNYSNFIQDTANQKFMLDLKEINRQQLLDLGMSNNQIEVSQVCTSCDNGNYFSYRADEGCSGRFMSTLGVRAS